MDEQQQAIIKFMGAVYGDTKKIDDRMVQPSSTLQPKSHLIENTIREQLAKPVVPGIAPTPEEIQASGVVGAPVEEQPTVGVPTQVEPTAAPLPPPPPPVAPAPPPQDITFETLARLDIIIEELKKLNNITGHEIKDSEG